MGHSGAPGLLSSLCVHSLTQAFPKLRPPQAFTLHCRLHEHHLTSPLPACTLLYQELFLKDLIASHNSSETSGNGLPSNH